MSRISAAEEGNFKKVGTVADQASAISSDIHTKVTTIRKFMAIAKDGISSVKSAIHTVSTDLEAILTVVDPLEEALTAMKLAQNEEELQEFQKKQEKRLEAEAQKHRSALLEIRQQRLSQLIEEDIRKAQQLAVLEASKPDSTQKPPTRMQATPRIPEEISVPISMRKDLEDFLSG